MINEKLAQMSESKKNEQAESFLEGIDRDVFAEALAQSPLDRHGEKEMKLNAQRLCLDHEDVISLRQELVREMPQMYGRKKTIRLMEYVLATNYLNEKKIRKEVKEWNEKRNKKIGLIVEKVKGRE